MTLVDRLRDRFGVEPVLRVLDIPGLDVLRLGGAPAPSQPA
jgi:hypothetical protein